MAVPFRSFRVFVLLSTFLSFGITGCEPFGAGVRMSRVLQYDVTVDGRQVEVTLFQEYLVGIRRTVAGSGCQPLVYAAHHFGVPRGLEEDAMDGTETARVPAGLADLAERPDRRNHAETGGGAALVSPSIAAGRVAGMR